MKNNVKRVMCKWNGKCIYEDKNGNRKFHPCPKNSNSRCQIITPKAKAKVRRVKAWACKVDIFNNFNMGFRVEFKKRAPNYVTPCTITIEEKWLKGGK